MHAELTVDRIVTGIVSVALAAGMVSAINPCGFAMLPAYLGLFVADRPAARASALRVGLIVSAGFVVVFTVVGVLVAVGVGAVIDLIPWLAALVGVGLIAAGVAIVAGARLPLRLPGLGASAGDRSLLGLMGFGVSYAVASLSCTLPIFLSLIAAALAGDGFVETVAVFVAYGAGMSLTVIAVTIAVAAGRGRLVRAVRPLAARLDLIGGLVMVISGAFILWYWATVLRADATALNANPLVGLIDGITGAVARVVAARPVLVAALLAATVGVSAAITLRRRTIRATADDLEPDASTPAAGAG